MSPLCSTSSAVITLVTLAIGRWVVAWRAHSTWPVLASASTAPFAFTPPGAPAVLICGLADGLGDGVTATRVGLAVAAGVCAGRDPCDVAGAAHAATIPTLTIPTVSETTRAANRMKPRSLLPGT